MKNSNNNYKNNNKNYNKNNNRNYSKKRNTFIDPDNIEVIEEKKVLKKRGNHNQNNKKNQVYKEPKIQKKAKIIDENESIIIKPKELNIIDNNEELHVYEDYNENDIILNFNDEIDTKKFEDKKEEVKEEKIIKEETKVKEEKTVKEEKIVKEEKPNNKKNNKKKKNKKNNIVNIIIYLIMIICLCTLGYSIYNIVLWKIDTKRTETVYEEIKSKVDITETVIDTSSIIIDTNSVTSSVTEEHKFNPYFDYINTNMLSVDISELIKENKDTTGWVKLEGTSINYPFVRYSDNDYYLTHSFNKKYNVSGWVFLDYRNDKDLTKNRNSIIYGHRRADQAMFGSLKNVLKKDWQKNINNHYIKISLEHYNLLYKIFSVYHLPVTSDYIQTDFDDNNEFKEFLNMIKNRSSYNFYTDVNETDTILTLSSCYGDNERVVVHAKLIQKQGK